MINIDNPDHQNHAVYQARVNGITALVLVVLSACVAIFGNIGLLSILVIVAISVLAVADLFTAKLSKWVTSQANAAGRDDTDHEDDFDEEDEVDSEWFEAPGHPEYMARVKQALLDIDYTGRGYFPHERPRVHALVLSTTDRAALADWCKYHGLPVRVATLAESYTGWCDNRPNAVAVIVWRTWMHLALRSQLMGRLRGPNSTVIKIHV